MLIGQNVRLRAIERTDIPQFLKFINDPAVTEFLLNDPPFNWEQEEQWYQQVHQGQDITYTIETFDGVVIGNISLLNLNYRNRKATLGIMIGEKEFQDRGLGTDAIRTMLRFAFEDLNLVRVCLIVDDRNLRALRCYEKCGFQKEGVLRKARYKNGVYVNDIVMSVLQDEWKAVSPNE